MYTKQSHRDPDKTHHDMLGAFLEQLPVRLSCHLTFPCPISQEQLDGALRSWIRRIQERHRLTVGYVAGQERWPARHLHVVLVAHRPLSQAYVQGAAYEVIRDLAALNRMTLRGGPSADCVQVKEYQRGVGGLSYAMKSEDADGCYVPLSDNLDLFATAGATRRCRPMSSRERRQARRIAAQRLNARN